ncbi:MAG TPA: glycoside hydrolase family 16 protein [Edaphobacter sp.]|uniref:glycoside hydrolase family 16 protein n=1 Tax=Edaphobacter sp. TaxID=1934404 RepID=UPI002C68FC02|nr:glycoside hydrolase family 16 protein [Edaphobacter sp.]HUZ96588.1 glycoside hydrolase family 16 protein [Edaphobacter sp.]
MRYHYQQGLSPALLIFPSTMIDIEPPSTLPNAAAAPSKWKSGLTRSLRHACLGCLALSFVGVAVAQSQTTVSTSPQWKLSWSDEFSGGKGSAPDPAKWSFDIGGKNPNNELESYTSRPANVQQKNGDLVITARKENYTGADGVARQYTSARIRTKGLFSQAYGRFEASIKLPLGKGIWPAFWLLGNNIDSVGWPKSGEIDIFENVGEPSISYSTLHGPGYSGAHGISKKYPLPAGEAVNTGFHLYAVEWAPNDIKFFLDNNLVAERTPADLPPGTKWVYDHPFFIILNVAVGGAWPGNPDATTKFPQKMLVDYVRVYTRSGESQAR